MYNEKNKQNINYSEGHLMKKLKSALLCIAIITAVFIPGSVTAFSADGAPALTVSSASDSTHDPDIINGNSYHYYTEVTRAYLCQTEDGFMRVYGNDNGTLLAEYYDSELNFIGNRYVETGLPMFGGFYDAGDCYIVVTGQKNPNESDETEVFRITRFDKDWNPTGYDSIYGGDTYVPFIAGRCAFAAYGNKLIIRTTHELYARNGRHHQTNMTLVADISRMRITDYYYDVGNINTAAYLSHSFNQFIRIDDDGTVVCFDHGDAHPRSAALGRFYTKADSLIINKPGYLTYEYTEIMKYAGEIGENFTGAMLGGLEISKTSYLTVGTAIDNGLAGGDDTKRAYNVYLSVTDKKANDLSTAETKLYYYSSFTENDVRYASNPKLVKINPDLFLIMWNELPVAEYIIGQPRVYDESCIMKYLFVDGSGNSVTDIMTAPRGTNAFVTECEPIVCGDRVMWYVSDGGDVSSIISMSLSGRITAYEHVVPESLFRYPIDMSQVRVSFRSFEPLSQDITITEDNLDEYVVVTYNDRILERGKDYNLSYDEEQGPITTEYEDGQLLKLTLRLEEAPGNSYFPMAYYFYWSAVNNPLFLLTPSQEDDGVHLPIYAYRGVGVHIYRKELGADGDYEMIGSINDRLIELYVDDDIPHDGTYSYYVREYTYDADGNEVLSEPSATRTIRANAISTPSEPPTEPPTEAPEEPPLYPVLVGDADGDYIITVIDSTVIRRVLAGLKERSEINETAADADGDGVLSIMDATLIQRYAADLETDKPIGKWQFRALLQDGNVTNNVTKM